MHINFKNQNICEIKTSTINMICRTEPAMYNNCHLPGVIYACMLNLADPQINQGVAGLVFKLGVS